jgi:hypothetical protein
MISAVSDAAARADLLTAAEHEAVAMAGRLYVHVRDKVCGNGSTRDDDLAELRALVHGIQRLVEAQAAARAYPQAYRLMGQVIEPPR